MAQKKEDEKTKNFVDFLLEESEDELQVVTPGDVDDSDFDEESREFLPLDAQAAKLEKEKEQKKKKEKVPKVTTLSSSLDDLTHDNIKEEPSQKTETNYSNDFPTVITKKEDLSAQVTKEEAQSSVHTEVTEQVSHASLEVAEEDRNISTPFSASEVTSAETESVEDLEDSLIAWKKSFDLKNASLANDNKQSASPILMSENLRMAQEKILSLEAEIDRLRDENQELQAACEVFRAKNDELLGKLDNLEYRKKEIEEKWKDDAKLSQMRVMAKQQEVQELKVKVESLELRLRRDLQMVRVRERELENRLEISKIENSAVLRSKDEHILELKRKIDQMSIEADQVKEKLSDLFQKNDVSKDKIRRTVRTLRLALNMLDDEDSVISEDELKKSG